MSLRLSQGQDCSCGTQSAAFFFCFSGLAMGIYTRASFFLATPGASLGTCLMPQDSPQFRGGHGCFFFRFADRHLIVHGVLTHFVAVWADSLKYKVAKMTPFSNCVFLKFCFLSRTALL